MKYFILSIAVALGLSFTSTAQQNTWVVSSGIAANYDSGTGNLFGSDYDYNTGVMFTLHGSDIYSGGLVKFDVDGREVYINGVFTSGSWVAANVLDSDCARLLQMCKAGSYIRIYKNGRLVFSNSLSGFTRAYNGSH